ncbi:MAG TPA: S-methyl-5'-thioadenosine phosphorylase [Actinomycetota bacterium]|nr:S-methyl-5'-thioadenosine phosphorylase [Actinomycetota bacterium]
MATQQPVRIGVFGGSGFYSFLEDVRQVEVETPYGPPSAPVAVGSVDGRPVAFLPRHGEKHQFPPHRVPYRANLWALKQLGVQRVLGPCAVGSLQPHVRPGEFVVCDQLVDRTSGRVATFYDGPETTHVSFADPYCPTLREVAVKEARELGLPVHERGTVVVIEGPRFSTRAESEFYSRQGWEVINMTQYPEAVLARELEMCYVNISLVTDYDVGVVGEVEPVTHEEVIRVFQGNLGRLRGLLERVIRAIPDERDCPCATALANARFNV